MLNMGARWFTDEELGMDSNTWFRAINEIESDWTIAYQFRDDEGDLDGLLNSIVAAATGHEVANFRR